MRSIHPLPVGRRDADQIKGQRKQMSQDTNHIEVYLEIGRTRTFAVALDWPGWCRSGRDEAGALQALCDYGPRYAHALQQTQLQFRAPSQVSALGVVERLAGNATT